MCETNWLPHQKGGSMRNSIAGVALWAFAGCVVLAYPGSPAVMGPAMALADETAPEGVKILLPRGGIPAIFEPTFVSASEADISDDAWILGIVIGTEARAYSLNLLNEHEVVNDRLGGRPIAAVW